MQIHHLSESNSILNHFVAQLRNIDVQQDSMRFRRNIERIGEVLAYEISKVFDYKPVSVTTPLGSKETAELVSKPVICSILRAGLPLHNGLLNYFDDADNGFISAYRHHPKSDDDYFDILVEYQAVPELKGRSLILADPMLATGQSLVAVFNKLMEKGAPSEIHIAIVIAAPEGVEHLKKHLPSNCHLWIAAIDDRLNEKNYIVPGLGDAGDLAYGAKL